MRLYFLLFFSLFFVLTCLAQDSIYFQKEAKELDYLADIMANAQKYPHKVRAAIAFKKRFDEVIHEPHSFDFPFEGLDWISIQKLNQNLRIITWQVQTAQDKFEYKGYLQTPDKIAELKDVAPDFQIEYAKHDPDNWYGALYYNFVPFKRNEKQYFILFGYDAHKENIKRKVADVLYMENGEFHFGYPVFKLEEESSLKSRLFFEYGVQSNFSLNYNPSSELIIRDHLMPIHGSMPGQSLVNVADGTYVGYEYKDDHWYEIRKLYNEILSEPLNTNKDTIVKEDKDIFGRIKKPKSKKRKN